MKWIVVMGFAVMAAGCRESAPPKIEVCILDGFGGSSCVEADGTRIYRAPSQMLNYWATNQPDIANLLSWCYDTDRETARAALRAKRQEILR